MLNYWWVTRPKRKLNSIPEVLAAFSAAALDKEWQGQRGSHLSFEAALEKEGLKRIGERRDQTGGGARTYKAWLMSLGLIFTHESTKTTKLTLAGEAIMDGKSPVEVLTNQVLKYQFPSPFSLSRNIDVNSRFKIHPFVFLLRLLADNRIVYLTQDEIAKIVVTEAENETDKCFEYIVSRILQFRSHGDAILDADFDTKYSSSKGNGSQAGRFAHLSDLANTLINWIEYTQLARRNDDSQLEILSGKMHEVEQILANPPKFIDRPANQEYFQRKYGIDPYHQKDTRDLTHSSVITAQIIAETKIKNAFIAESLRKPISKITPALVDSIAETTGIESKLVEETLLKFYPRGAVGAFMTEYFEMAFKGRDQCTEFEIATTEIFRDIFHINSIHLGQTGSKSAPDVLLISDEDNYQAIIDTKAYHKYSITGDHRNRMVHNYIERASVYSDCKYPIGFFAYIAGGFSDQIDKQIRGISAESGVHGAGINVSNMIKLIEKQESSPFSHASLRGLFSADRQILLSDI